MEWLQGLVPLNLKASALNMAVTFGLTSQVLLIRPSTPAITWHATPFTTSMRSAFGTWPRLVRLIANFSAANVIGQLVELENIREFLEGAEF